jgi:hypothetical protein
MALTIMLTISRNASKNIHGRYDSDDNIRKWYVGIAGTRQPVGWHCRHATGGGLVLSARDSLWIGLSTSACRFLIPHGSAHRVEPRARRAKTSSGRLRRVFAKMDSMAK